MRIIIAVKFRKCAISGRFLFCFVSNRASAHQARTRQYTKQNEQRKLPSNYQTRMIASSKKPVFEMVLQANFEGRWYTGKKIHQNWQNGLCVPAGISKTACKTISKIGFFWSSWSDNLYAVLFVHFVCRLPSSDLMCCKSKRSTIN